MKARFSGEIESDMQTFVVMRGGKVLGYMDVSRMEDGRGMLNSMYVAPEAQGQGLGGKLIEKALEVLGRDKDIVLEVVSYNDKAIGFYEHYGFEKTNNPVPKEEGRPDYLKELPQIEMVLKANSN